MVFRDTGNRRAQRNTVELYEVALGVEDGHDILSPFRLYMVRPDRDNLPIPCPHYMSITYNPCPVTYYKISPADITHHDPRSESSRAIFRFPLPNATENGV